MNKVFNYLTLKGPKERIVVIIAGLIFLRLIPIGGLGTVNLCVYELLFGNTNHYSHGITRAMSSFLKGNFQRAYEYNRLVYVVMGVIFIMLIVDSVKLISDKISKKE